MDTAKINQSMYEKIDQSRVEQQKEFNKNIFIRDLYRDTNDSEYVQENQKKSIDS